MFNICCDDKIPFAKEAFNHVGNVTYRKGNRLTSTDLKRVDVLFIRSGTKVDSSLLEGTPVQFIASATAGTDHVDRAYLDRKGIPFYHAPGCNADSVVEYITAALFVMADRQNTRIAGKRMGIVGAGNVGGRLARKMTALGIDVVVSDPPLLETNPEMQDQFTFVGLDELLQTSDIISLHVPLVREGRHPTYHLFNEERILAMKQGAWLFNASRGAVISNEALKGVIDKNHLGGVVLDVWEGEPGIDIELLKKVDLGTAHIAGYSYEGKVNGTIMIYEAFLKHYGIEPAWHSEGILKPSSEDNLVLQWPTNVDDHQSILSHLARYMYNIEEDDRRFRASIDLPAEDRAAYFLTLRKEYPRRRTFGRFTLSTDQQLDEQLISRLTNGLGIRIASPISRTQTS